MRGANEPLISCNSVIFLMVSEMKALFIYDHIEQFSVPRFGGNATGMISIASLTCCMN